MYLENCIQKKSSYIKYNKTSEVMPVEERQRWETMEVRRTPVSEKANKRESYPLLEKLQDCRPKGTSR